MFVLNRYLFNNIDILITNFNLNIINTCFEVHTEEININMADFMIVRMPKRHIGN